MKTTYLRMGQSLVTAIAVFALRCSATTIIYDNGPSNLSDGANMSAYFVADDFVLSSNYNLEGVSWASSADSDPYPQYSNLVDWAILNDNSGSPGSIVTSGSSSPTFTDTGSQILGTEEFQLSIPLNPSVAISPGTYWLSLSVDPNGNLTQGVYWDTTSATHGSVAMSSTSLSGPWSPPLSGADGTDLSFSIDGTGSGPLREVTPENATGGITFALLVSMAALRCRSQIASKLKNALRVRHSNGLWNQFVRHRPW